MPAFCSRSSVSSSAHAGAQPVQQSSMWLPIVSITSTPASATASTTRGLPCSMNVSLQGVGSARSVSAESRLMTVMSAEAIAPPTPSNIAP